MSRRIGGRGDLLERWRDIEEEEEREGGNAGSHASGSNQVRLHQLKEQWFVDAFNFLICLPKETHIWCDSWDLMGPLLETFYNYFKDERQDSPLRLLWKRISEEMKTCIRCISQHHQALEMYRMEYELSSIGPLLDVLQSLDEERVTQHLREINERMARKDYFPAHDNAEVVSVMYEVLMHPVLLDDKSLFFEFEAFIEAIDNVHELALDRNQQFPGVYALFFFKRRVRFVAHRLAESMGKLRRAVDLEPLQQLLKKFIGSLETEVMPSTSENLRPRLELDRSAAWIGIKSLIGFLEPPALEEGILESYPIFLDVVLNQVSSDSPVFSHAVTCLKLLFEMLGCKLWLRSALSPSIMRSTLVGQCFHSRNEKIHKDIFELFQPLLQSLEAWQDGELEKQRRNFLYFLLQQVPVSSNFSVLTRQKACQIAFLIIHRGYNMNPPSPPFECSHMWGPSLVSSLKDSSLHPSLRQPALDLIQTIMVSDAAALISSSLSFHTRPSIVRSAVKLNDAEDDDEPAFLPYGVEEEKFGAWRAFSSQNLVVSREYRGWMCIPMLWTDVLVETDPTVLPLSFSKAVFWARSRLLFVEPDISGETYLPIQSWILSFAEEMSSAFGWKVPTGSDDGGDGKLSKNSVEASSMCLPLIKTFNRLTGHFLVQMAQGLLLKQWTWEPRMSGSLILLLADPNDNVRHSAKSILEQVSGTRGLTCGLKYLCSFSLSLSAVLSGLKHALLILQVQSDSVGLNFHTLQHFFFLVRKLLNEGNPPTLDVREEMSSELTAGKLSSQGGFLRQPVFDSLTADASAHSSNASCDLLEKFNILLSEAAWPSIEKCLMIGKTFIDHSICQMTCVRILELLPVVFEKNCRSIVATGNSGMSMEKVMDYGWLQHLMEWGKSSLNVIVIYWKKTVISLLEFLKGAFSGVSSSLIRSIENLITSDSVSLDELMKQVSCLSVSLSMEASTVDGKTNFSSHVPFSPYLSAEKEYPTLAVRPSSGGILGGQILETAVVSSKKDPNYVVISDDETEKHTSPSFLSRSKSEDEANASVTQPKDCMLVGQKAALERNSPQIYHAKKTSGTRSSNNSPIVCNLRETTENPNLSSRRQNLDTLIIVDSKSRKITSDCSLKGTSSFQDEVPVQTLSAKAAVNEKKDQCSSNEISEAGDEILKELVSDTKDDPQKSVTRSVKLHRASLTNPSTTAPKRQLIQLKSSIQNRGGYLHRRQAGNKRFQPLRLDEWYRPILEIDYFATVGSSSIEDDKKLSELKEVPLCFESAEQYVDIFRPLVLEEFKAQLRSSYLEMSSLEDVYCGRLSVLSVDRVDDFHLVRFVHDDPCSASGKSFSENDLVLLTKEPVQSPSHEIHMVGKVERRERDHQRKSSTLVIRFYLQNASSRLNQARRLLIDRSKWHGSRIMSITPQLREFQALSSIKNIPILKIILDPTNNSWGMNEVKPSHLGKLSRSLRQMLEATFNDSQLQAISASISSLDSCKDCRLSLIQGPPGTGKTRTIVAIVSVLLASLQRTDETKSSWHESLNGSSTSFAKFRPKIRESVAIARAWQDAALARQLNKDAENSTKPMEHSVRGRVLICAQSNAAVDELVSRISSEGLYGCDGKMYKPFLVRVGNAKTVHSNSLPYFIDTLVDKRLAEEKNSTDARNDVSTVQLRANLEKLVDRIRYYEAKRANIRDENTDLACSLKDESKKLVDGKEMSDEELEMKLKELYEQKRHIYKELSLVQAQEKKANEEIRALKHKLRKSMLREAEIIVTTLSGSGGDLYEVCSESMSNPKYGSPSENSLFDAVVIDEAAQALEPATLIPLQLLKSMGTNCIMVGDPKQLPATVMSNIASKFLYECSMFERLQRAGYPVTMLTKQYRMHPEICQFPSSYFYDGKLLNGDIIDERSVSFHQTKGLGPYIFYDIVDGVEMHGENSGASSLCNEREVDAAVELLSFFKRRHSSEFVGGRIGIITPYKRQLSLLRSRFYSAFGSPAAAEMEFNTVDGFQGREVDILILSTVRAAKPGSAMGGISSSTIGFVADVRRMNVALTRAKLSLWILGNSRTLKTNRSWAALLEDAKARSLFVSVKTPYRSMFDKALGSESERCSVELNHHKKLEISIHGAQRTENYTKGLTRKKAEYVGHAVPRSQKETGERRDASIREDALSKKEGLKRKHYLLQRDNAHSIGADEDVMSTRDATFASEEHAMDGKRRAKERNEEKYNNALRNKVYSKSSKSGRAGKNTDAGDTDKHLDHCASEKGIKSSELERSQRNLNDCLLEDKVGNDFSKGAALDGKRNDLIVKRKQQREAVDALLSSSLIPSKKSEASGKAFPAKRPGSGKLNTGPGIKPSKRRGTS
ncbi:uncharacterized protein LOC115752685 isoform X1 [Rhodamnia argentea]|uniref:Uncharacterized protein LOC115752685 isoform X1 n=1 Tax=Rhodamnia argentea TaxID=178133 RepID=A0A8B8QI19_9MYRT|nr:uncharacterized protein LOC115752685 isoform X1 [Rhodamnia argentea]